MKKKWKILNGAVFLVWIALIALLVYRDYTGTGISLQKRPALDEAFSKKTSWYDIYAGERKIGYASTSYEKAGDELIIKHEREMKVYRNDKEHLLLEKLKCLSDLRYAIKSFEYTSNFDHEKGVKVTGRVDSGEIIFFLESPEKRKTHKTRTDNVFYLPTTFLPVVTRDNPAPNTVFSIPFLNFAGLSINPVKVTLEEIMPLKVGANISSVYKFRAGDIIWWCNEKGEVLKEKTPLGAVLYAQVEVFAKDPAGRMLFDYTELPSIKANRVLSDSEAINSLRIRIRNFQLNPAIYINSPITVSDGILEIRKRSVKDIMERSYQLPYEEAAHAKYIQQDDWVRSEFKPLKDTGLIYARSQKYNAASFAQYLTGYLYQLVRSTPTFFLSNSEQILKSLQGDYLERTVMFATYARAAGLPTRLVGGFVYLRGYFYFHAWPEIWLNEWIPVDPTFSQFPADVTHIPLKEGTLQDITSSLAEDLKKTTIEILEAS